jgi:hypothetical protein
MPAKKSPEKKARVNWTHVICVECWATQEEPREPVVLRVFNDKTGELIRGRRSCCYCGRVTDAGIMRRGAGCPGYSNYHDEDRS